MQLEQVNQLLSEIDGNFSRFYPMLKDRLDGYREDENAFWGEFMFFEDRYLRIKKHMLENGVKQDIVDIGCQFGFQSEIFLDAERYVGIDRWRPSRFFNADKPNVDYLVGLFPDVGDVKGKTVISSMSLGYFSPWVDMDVDVAEQRIADALKEAETLYIATTRAFADKVAPYFSRVTVLEQVDYGDFSMYLMTKEGER